MAQPQPPAPSSEAQELGIPRSVAGQLLDSLHGLTTGVGTSTSNLHCPFHHLRQDLRHENVDLLDVWSGGGHHHFFKLLTLRCVLLLKSLSGTPPVDSPASLECTSRRFFGRLLSKLWYLSVRLTVRTLSPRCHALYSRVPSCPAVSTTACRVTNLLTALRDIERIRNTITCVICECLWNHRSVTFIVSCTVLGSLVVVLVVFCGAWSVSYPRPPPQREHGCTVGIDRDHPCDATHPGRMMGTSDHQLLRACLQFACCTAHVVTSVDGGFVV